MNVKGNVRRCKQKKRGRVCAYIDNITFAIINFYSNYFVYSPFVDVYTNNRNRISFGKDAGIVFLQVGWIMTVIIIFSIYRGGFFDDGPQKVQLKKTSFWLFLISVIMLILSILISPFIESIVLESINGNSKLIFMNRLYTQYLLFCAYSLIRWVCHFDYYEYYYYERGRKYNLSFYYYSPLVVAGVAFLAFSIKKRW
ncbi:hypothetical protein I6N95_25380 [Vagococcus sp. BWB3-3]|uniref:Uncharacterized protein n=1 Tax=Vagococcus allomyrinae TaxID=2794353 RepID=A0A940PIS7_9ENTE|nr:hypothetical protein [Vagococcus allomyrinae]MBP1044346.1 hypothetical protein [Vagococcus allomyrinae]